MHFLDAKKRDAIIKSNIVDSFQYGDSKLLLSKTGKEIKNKLQEKIIEIKVDINNLTNKLEQLKSQCNQKPTESIPSYWLEPYDDRISLPILIYGKSSELVRDSDYPATTQPDQQQSQCMREYDRTVRQIISRHKELIELDTIIRGIVESKSYQLTIRQATILGL